MAELEWVTGCPEQKVNYLLPHPVYGDVLITRVPTPDVFGYMGGNIEYQESEPVYWDGDSWVCLDWNFERNEFVLAQSQWQDEWRDLENPEVQRDLLKIVYGEHEAFQMKLM